MREGERSSAVDVDVVERWVRDGWTDRRMDGWTYGRWASACPRMRWHKWPANTHYAIIYAVNHLRMAPRANQALRRPKEVRAVQDHHMQHSGILGSTTK